MLNICQMSPGAQTLAGFADLGDVVSFVHDFVSLHPAPHKDFQLVRKNTSSSSDSGSAWHPSNPEDEADMHARIQHGISHDSGTNFKKPVFKEDNRWRIQ